MKMPLAKLKAMLRYFCSNTDPQLLGKTKLMKLFYFSDFDHLRKYGSPITFDTYYHLERGPVPSTILNLVNSVVDNEESSILSDTIYIEQTPISKLQKINCRERFTERDMDYFSQLELETMAEVCRRFSNKTTKYIVEVSHNEAPWANTKETDKIPYSLATNDPELKQDIEFLEKRMAVLEYGNR